MHGTTKFLEDSGDFFGGGLEGAWPLIKLLIIPNSLAPDDGVAKTRANNYSYISYLINDRIFVQDN